MSEDPFTVVFVDNFRPRAIKYRIKGSPHRIRLCDDLEELDRFFQKERANLVFISCTFKGWNKVEDIARALARHFYNLKFDGVIVNTPVKAWGRDLVAALRAACIPARWYPYNWRTPSLHTHVPLRKSLED